MNLPRTLVKSRTVAIDGGTSPSMKKFGATSPGMCIWFMMTMMTKNEARRVTAKNSAAPTMYPNNLRLSRTGCWSVAYANACV